LLALPSPSTARCLPDRPQYGDFSHPFWLVRTDPEIECHGDPQFWGADEYPDHPLLHPIDPTPFALVMAARAKPMRSDLGIFDGSVPASPVLPDPEPHSVAEARTIVGLGMKVTIRLVP
jgi:hypothetical protein